MRLLDILKNSSQEGRELSELSRLQARLRDYAGSIAARQNTLISRVLERVLAEAGITVEEPVGKAIRQLLTSILAFDGLFTLDDFPHSAAGTTAGVWEAIRESRRRLAALEDRQVREAIAETLTRLAATILPEHLPPQGD